MRDCGVGANGLVGADYKPDLAVSFGDTGYDGGARLGVNLGESFEARHAIKHLRHSRLGTFLTCKARRKSSLSTG